MPALTVASPCWFALEVDADVPVRLTRPQRAESGVDARVRDKELTVHFAQKAQDREEKQVWKFFSWKKLESGSSWPSDLIHKDADTKFTSL